MSTSRVTQAVLSAGGEMKEDPFWMMMGLNQDSRAYTATKMEESSVCLFVLDCHRSSSIMFSVVMKEEKRRLERSDGVFVVVGLGVQ